MMRSAIFPANAHGRSDTLKFHSMVVEQVVVVAACYAKQLEALFFRWISL